MSSGKSEQSSSSSSLSQGQTFLAPWQVPFLQNLQGGATDLLNQQAGNIGDYARGLADNLGVLGNRFQSAFGEFAGGNPAAGVNEAVTGLLNFGGFRTLANQIGGQALPGQSTLEAIAGGPGPGVSQAPIAGQDIMGRLTEGLGQQLLQPSPGLTPALDALSTSIQENLQETLGSIAGQATLAGATGGARQALASGEAAEAANLAFGQGAAGLIGQDFATRQQLAPQITMARLSAAGQMGQQDLALRDLTSRSALASTGQQLGAASALQQGGMFTDTLMSDLMSNELGRFMSLGQLGLGVGQQQLGAAQAGMGALPAQFNLGMAPFQSAFSPFMNASQIINPILLAQNMSRGSSQGSGSSFSFGLPGD